VTAAPDTAAEELPPDIQPLVLWTPPAEGAAPGATPITVDNMLLKWLRPHQREGVQFCFEVRCVCVRVGVVCFDKEQAAVAATSASTCELSYVRRRTDA
jgi:hypothetical protein